MDFDFNENQQVDNLEKVPQDFRGLYVEGEDGKYKLDSENESVKSAVSAVTRLNQALRAARADAKAKGEKSVDLSPLEDFGKTPDEIRQAFDSRIEELRTELTKDGDAKVNLDKIKQEMATAHAKDLEKREAREKALQDQLYGMLVKSEAVNAIAEAKGDTELLMPFIVNQVKVVEEDGQFQAYVVDPQGDRRYSGVTGQPMTIKELVAEMKGNEKYGRLFESEQPPGGGTPPGGPSQRPAPRTQQLSANEKISAGLAKQQYSNGRGQR